MSNEFMPADVGRDITAAGGLGTITGYTDGENVTVTVLSPFPATAFDSGDWTILGSPQATCTPSAADPVGSTITLTLGTAGWRASDVGRYVKINGGLCRITVYTSTTIVSAVVEVELNAAGRGQCLDAGRIGVGWPVRISALRHAARTAPVLRRIAGIPPNHLGFGHR